MCVGWRKRGSRSTDNSSDCDLHYLLVISVEIPHDISAESHDFLHLLALRKYNNKITPINPDIAGQDLTCIWFSYWGGESGLCVFSSGKSCLIIVTKWYQMITNPNKKQGPQDMSVIATQLMLPVYRVELGWVPHCRQQHLSENILLALLPNLSRVLRTLIPACSNVSWPERRDETSELWLMPLFLSKGLWVHPLEEKIHYFAAKEKSKILC